MPLINHMTTSDDLLTADSTPKLQLALTQGSTGRSLQFRTLCVMYRLPQGESGKRSLFLRRASFSLLFFEMLFFSPFFGNLQRGIHGNDTTRESELLVISPSRSGNDIVSFDNVSTTTPTSRQQVARHHRHRQPASLQLNIVTSKSKRRSPIFSQCLHPQSQKVKIPKPTLEASFQQYPTGWQPIGIGQGGRIY